MKDLLDFAIWPDDPESLGVVQAQLSLLGDPVVVFPSELFTAGEMRQPERLHGMMRRLGYVTVQPRDNGRWRWYKDGSEFAARWCYVDERFAFLADADPAELGSKIDEKGASIAARN